MKIAFVIYEGMTALDFVGAYDPLARLKTMGFIPDLRWEICGLSKEVKDSTGLCFKPTWIIPTPGERRGLSGFAKNKSRLN